MKAKKIKILYAILCVALVFGVILGVKNMENLEKSALISPNYVENALRNMRRNYMVLGYDWDSDIAEMYESIYTGDVASGNACIVGFVLAGISVLALIVCFFKQQHEIRRGSISTQ